MKIIPAIAARHAEHSRWRHTLHAQPELAYAEHLTADFVAAKLDACDIPYVRGLGRTGIVATITGHSPGRSVGLRADMDALPLQEMNDFAHRSQHPGVMHACGHDGHTVMLLAAAEYLARERAFAGTVYCIFQPAEEGEAGAKAMMDDGLFERFPMDAVFGLHNWPWLPMGQMAMRTGPMMASMDIFEATVRGRGGHAAQPHMAVDPIVVAAAIVQAWQTIVARNVDPLESGVVSVTQIHAGHAWAVIPEEVSLRGTVRTFNPAVQALIEQRLRELGEGLATAHGCTFDWRYERRFPATINSVAETDFAAAVGSELLGADNILRNAAPSMGSEDFGWMLQVKQGSYVWLGTGGETSCLLHNPRYDFNDAAIPLGASYWVALAHAFLNP
jgi:hippurate hydrolase